MRALHSGSGRGNATQQTCVISPLSDSGRWNSRDSTPVGDWPFQQGCSMHISHREGQLCRFVFFLYFSFFFSLCTCSCLLYPPFLSLLLLLLCCDNGKLYVFVSKKTGGWMMDDERWVSSGWHGTWMDGSWDRCGHGWIPYWDGSLHL